MAKYGNSFEGGTDGADITTANSGGASGNPWSAAAGVKYATDQAMHNLVSAKVANPGASTGQFRRSVTGATKLAGRLYIRQTDWPASDHGLFRITVTGDTKAMTIYTKGDATLAMDSADTTQIWRSTVPLVADTWYRLEYWADLGDGATTGQLNAAVYEGDSTTPLDTPGPISGVNLGNGATAFLNARFGKLSGTAWTGTMWMDDEATWTDADAAAGFIGPYTEDPVVVHLVKTWDGTEWQDGARGWGGDDWHVAKAWTGTEWVQ